MGARWLLVLVLTLAAVRTEGQRDVGPEGVRRIPPAGVVVPADERPELERGVEELGREIEALRAARAPGGIVDAGFFGEQWELSEAASAVRDSSREKVAGAGAPPVRSRRRK